MGYVSTRDASVRVSASTAITRGISAEGGLFVPEQLPYFEAKDFALMASMDYIGRAKTVLKGFLEDFSDEELTACVQGAYSGSFENEQPAPLVKLADGTYSLELWHGPTCAFKDLALQLLPYLLTASAKKTADGKKIVILVATSGDTGKAALEGFKDVPGTEMVVFYPVDGVSPMQKLQMASQTGENVHVCAIRGNFDDAQTAVKQIFTNDEIKALLAKNNMAFSSANSINWGRLVPQIVYYVSTYCDLLNAGVDLSDGFNVVVPTGNFGNILSAYYAKQIGVPIAKLICASNANNVLTDFIRTGTYDRNRPFYTTMSPSMDILISSNLERLLFEVYDRDATAVAALQSALNTDGIYTVTEEAKKRIESLFYGGCCDDEMTLETIRREYEKNGYLCDTHTAVAMAVKDQYLRETGDSKPCVVVSTASPYKFAKSVLSAVSDKTAADEFGFVSLLHDVTGTAVPAPIAALETAKVRFTQTVNKDEMREAVLGCLSVTE